MKWKDSAIFREQKEKSDARRSIVEPRGKIIREHFKDAFRLSSAVIVAGMMRFGGNVGPEITPRDPELALWGLWERDQKRAIDRAVESGNAAEAVPLPPLPSWFPLNDGVFNLCNQLDVKINR